MLTCLVSAKGVPVRFLSVNWSQDLIATPASSTGRNVAVVDPLLSQFRIYPAALIDAFDRAHGVLVAGASTPIRVGSARSAMMNKIITPVAVRRIMGRYGDLNYGFLTKAGFLFGLGLLLFGAGGEILPRRLRGPACLAEHTVYLLRGNRSRYRLFLALDLRDFPATHRVTARRPVLSV